MASKDPYSSVVTYKAVVVGLIPALFLLRYSEVGTNLGPETLKGSLGMSIEDRKNPSHVISEHTWELVKVSVTVTLQNLINRLTRKKFKMALCCIFSKFRRKNKRKKFWFLVGDLFGTDGVVGVEEDTALAADVLLRDAVTDAGDTAQRAAKWRKTQCYSN